MATISHYRSVQPTFAVADQSHHGQQFSFVTIQNPSELKQKARQSQIRKHAKRDVDRLRARKLRATIEPLSATRPGVLAKVSRSPATSDVNPRRHVSEASTEDGVDSAFDQLDVDSNVDSCDVPSPLPPIGAGRGFVPFAGYPLEPTPRMVMLLDYMLETERLHHRHVRMLWITIAMFDRDSFNVTMAHASNLLAHNHGLEYFETPESIHFYTITVQAVSKRLASPTESTTDGLIGTILGLACLDISYANWKRWRTHIDGIRRILLLRGGLKTLHTSTENSMTAFWNDTSGSLVLDKEPSFPVSSYIQPRVISLGREQKEQYKQMRGLTSITFSTMGDIFAGLHNLAAFVDNDQVGSTTLQQECFVVSDLSPFTHTILSLPRLSSDEKMGKRSDSLIHEALRLALLLFVGLIKQFYHIGATGLEGNHRRLIRLLDKAVIDWTNHSELQLWTFVLAAVSAKEDHSIRLEQLEYVAQQQAFNSWSSIYEVAKNILWSDKILGKDFSAMSVEEDHISGSQC